MSKIQGEDARIVEAMGRFGFHAKYIREITGISIWVIYKFLREIGISLRDYRNGIGKEAELVKKKYIFVKISTKVETIVGKNLGVIK